MARITAATRESVPEDQRDSFDQLVNERGSVPASGPIGVMIHAPEMTRLGEALRAYLRGDSSSLPLKVRELAMIVTAREMDCQFIWNAHAAMARQSGVSDNLVDSLRDRKDLPGLAPDEAAVIHYGQEFFRTHRVSQATFDAAKSQFGVRGLAELSSLMGYYAMLAFNVNAFEMEIPDSVAETPLPV